MIRLTFQDDRPQVAQQLCPPVVYLDHWALMDIADNSRLADTFSDTVVRTGGTWALSWLNIAEFVAVSEPRHARNAESILDRVRPHLFFIEPNMFEVIKREDRLLGGGTPESPVSDSRLLQSFVGYDSKSVDPLSAGNIFSVVAAGSPRSYTESVGRIIVEQVGKIREQYTGNEDLRRRMNAPTRGPKVPAGTRFLMRDLLALVAKNQSSGFGVNDAIDFLHTIVPCSYCEHVLIDGHWATQVEQARRRLRGAGHEFPIAQVHSRRNSGLDRFLDGWSARKF